MEPSKINNLWQATNRETIDARPLQGETTADLVVIGGGMTGCSAALHAAKAGVDVVLLEAKTIGFGGSGRNVGLVNAGLWMPPAKVEETIGVGPGKRLNTVLAGAPDLVFSLIEEHDIECDSVRSGTLHCAHSPAGMVDLTERHAQLSQRDAPVVLLDRDETKLRIGSPCFSGALHDARAGTLQPLAYCCGLARAAVQSGARIHVGSNVIGVRRADDVWTVETGSGSVRARAVLVATNAYGGETEGIPASAVVPVHYFQMATRPLEPEHARSILPGLEGCWDTALVMSSFRRDGQGRLVVGAVGSLDHGAAVLHRHWAKRKLRRLFPELPQMKVEFSWCGRIAMTSDHIPKIIRLGPGALSIFGYSGRGIAPGTLFGARAASALTEGNEDDLPVEPVDVYQQKLLGPRAVGIELGAALYHATGF